MPIQKNLGKVLSIACCLVVTACNQADTSVETNEKPKEVVKKSIINAQRLANADKEPHNWMAIGRDNREQFYSPLTQVNDKSVKELGLEWTFDLDTNRGQQATPLIVDGVMYFSTAWSKVKALNALTGELLWAFDPEVDPVKAAQPCCDAVNRGVALWEGRVYVATLDGRLIALNAETGAKVWDVLTIPEKSPYTITGAPRIAKGKVFIGNGGAEVGGRGYVTAYDAESGEQLWRFYTVPGDPSKPQENPILEMAKETWNGQWYTMGGGGTVWDAIVYDEELDQLYLGVGNGGPHDISIRSPGGGDNLFVGSIVALNPDTGDYLWHFQMTPEDAWDWTSSQPIILTDLEIKGKQRKVLLQAPKNGFFYVLDRETGEYISGDAYAPLTWAAGLDENGRPMISPEARYYKTGLPYLSRPGPNGAHNWQPMAYNQNTQLVYVPVNESPFIRMKFGDAPAEGESISVQEATASDKADPELINKMMAEMNEQIIKELKGYLIAWDPVQRKQIWRTDRDTVFNGGVLTTAGNLVFQGDANGEFAAFKADTGEQVWSYETHSGILAAPSTFTLNGEQYVSVIQGWGGGYALLNGHMANLDGRKRNISRVLTFKLGGGMQLPEPPPFLKLSPPEAVASQEDVMVGMGSFMGNCSRCHGMWAVSGGTIPDLRYSPILHSKEGWNAIVNGARLAKGMPSFSEKFNEQETEQIRAYVISQANEALKQEVSSN